MLSTSNAPSFLRLRRHWRQWQLLAVLLASLLAVSLTEPAQAAAMPDLDYFEQRIVELTNAKRAQFSLPPMRLNRELTAAARWFSWDSVANRPGGYCGHDGSDGSAFWQRTQRFGYTGFAQAENAQCAYMTPEVAVDGWFNETPPNDGHRQNLLNPDNRDIGVGYYRDPRTGRGYITQDFGRSGTYLPLVINSDAPVTGSANVNLYIYGTLTTSYPSNTIDPPTQMRISNSPDLSGASWESFNNYRSWTVAGPPNSFKNIYVQVRDSSGRTLTATDNIYWGASVPSGLFDSLAQSATNLFPYVNSGDATGENHAPNLIAADTAAGVNTTLFVRGSDHAIWINQAPWNNWQSLGGYLSSGPGVSPNANGTTELCAKGGDDGIWCRNKSGGSWQNWYGLGGLLASSPGMGLGSDGTTHLCAKGINNDIWCRAKVGGAWQGWYGLGGLVIGSPALGQNANGTLEMCVRGTDNGIWCQTRTASGWQGWYGLGGIAASSPALGLAADGSTVVCIRGSDSAIWCQNKVAGTWRGWYGVGGIVTSSPALGRNASGALQMFIRGSDGAIWATNHAGGNSWTGWQYIGGIVN